MLVDESSDAARTCGPRVNSVFFNNIPRLVHPVSAYAGDLYASLRYFHDERDRLVSCCTSGSFRNEATSGSRSSIAGGIRSILSRAAK